jgi:hypothetical protein
MGYEHREVHGKYMESLDLRISSQVNTKENKRSIDTKGPGSLITLLSSF